MKKGSLSICGAGIDYPWQTSVEAVDALRACDVVFSNLPGKESREFLALFCADVRHIDRPWRGDETVRASAMFRELAKGRRVGFVTVGHPMLFGGLAFNLVRRCRESGIACRTYAAVSGIDVLLAARQASMGDDFDGVVTIASGALVERGRADTGLPMCVYLQPRGARAGMVRPRVEPAHLRALARTLARLYPADHTVSIHGIPSDPARGLDIPIRELPEALLPVGPEKALSYVIFVPPAAGGKRG